MHKLLVTPVLAFLSKPELITTLVPAQAEVSHIFSHPLRALLNPTLSITEDLVAIGSENWPYETEFHVRSEAFSLPLAEKSSYSVCLILLCLGWRT